MFAKLKGFTMIELVVAIAIVVLLIAVSVVSYQDHMARKARLQARQVMLELSDWLRLQHAQAGGYQVPLPYAQAPRDGDAQFRISLVRAPLRASDPAVEFPATTATRFTLRADALNGDACGVLLLDDGGRKGVLSSGAGVADCWQ